MAVIIGSLDVGYCPVRGLTSRWPGKSISSQQQPSCCFVENQYFARVLRKFVAASIFMQGLVHGTHPLGALHGVFAWNDGGRRSWRWRWHPRGSYGAASCETTCRRRDCMEHQERCYTLYATTLCHGRPIHEKAAPGHNCSTNRATSRAQRTYWRSRKSASTSLSVPSYCAAQSRLLFLRAWQPVLNET